SGGPVRARLILDVVDFLDDGFESGRHELMHQVRVRPLNEVGFVSISLEKACECLVGETPKHGRVSDLVTIQMEDWQDRSIRFRIQKFVRVPACRQRPRFALTVADDAAGQQIRIVEDRAEGMHERIAKLSTFVYGSRSLGSGVARNSSWKRKLLEQF